LWFGVLLVACGLGTLERSLADAERNFGEVAESDWQQTNIWLKAADCARATGAWLALCRDDGTLFPISEEALGDDPGHALLLAVWAIATGDRLSLVDVAHLNIVLNAAGLALIAAFVFALRAYLCAGLFLYLGPVVYLKWIGVAPHWGLLGIASMVVVLPLAMVAREWRFLPPRLGSLFIGLGLAGLALAGLVREAIGLMGLLAALGALVVIVVRRWQAGAGGGAALSLGALIALACASPYVAVAARDAAFDVAPARLVERHGFSDILFMGLGAVPNRFGIEYSDWVALANARQVDPEVVLCTPQYYRIMWKLYLETVTEAPQEVARIYLEKARLFLSDPVLEPAPPLGVVLLLGLVHFLAAIAFGAWNRLRFPQGAVLEGAALAFIGLFFAQAILASPARGYAMPVGAAILILGGVLLDFCARAVWLLVQARLARIEGRSKHPMA
jgi:hypothetical protein